MNYDAAAERLGVEVAAVKAVAEVESSGVPFWTIGGEKKPPVRLEAHWFGKFTKYAYNDTHPHISSRSWNPSLAARTHAGAWEQVKEAASLDREAAYKATSWGAYQIMGFNYRALGFSNVYEMVDAMNTEEGQLDGFVRFILADAVLLDALRRKDWHAFAGRYNGPGQVEHYAAKMADAYARLA